MPRREGEVFPATNESEGARSFRVPGVSGRMRMPDMSTLNLRYNN